MSLQPVEPAQYAECLEVWENSVRATHSFLSEDDITFFKPLVLEQAFPATPMKCYIDSNTGAIQGFIGVVGSKIEMLFVRNECRGQGIGKTLLVDARSSQDVDSVDVNEQNPSAVGFYKHMGFKVVSRSELDDTGKPFPILHMKL